MEPIAHIYITISYFKDKMASNQMKQTNLNKSDTQIFLAIILSKS